MLLSAERSGILPIKNRKTSGKCKNGDEWEEIGDEEEDLLWELQAEASVSAATTWPAEVYAYVKFGYDNTMKTQLEEDGTSFSEWIDSVMTHVQSYYQHSSLPTQIQFKVTAVNIL